MSPMTIEGIAELAEVSRSTVSRVLNEHPNVRASVRDRVLSVIQEHGYAPHAAARSLASQRTRVIGLLVPRSAATLFADPFFPFVIQGITEACSELGYFLMLSMISPQQEEGFYHRILRGRHFDGVIMLSSDVDDPILPLLMKDQSPLVLVGRHPYFPGLSWVDAENREGARQAVAHLIGLGHRRIATITGGAQMVAGIDRRDGYKQALLEAGLPLQPQLLVEGEFTQQSGYNAMQQLLQLPERPTAVFVASDTMAMGSLHALQENGVRVPEEMAVVSFDDLPTALFANPPLTTMRQPIYRMGAQAVRVLIERIEQPQRPPTQQYLPVELVIRQSCGSHLERVPERRR